LTFTKTGGRTLTLTTTGRATTLRGVTRPVAGWTFLVLRARTASIEITVHSTAGSRIQTTFAVR
jgi:hypothetical protein